MDEIDELSNIMSNIVYAITSSQIIDRISSNSPVDNKHVKIASVQIGVAKQVVYVGATVVIPSVNNETRLMRWIEGAGVELNSVIQLDVMGIVSIVSCDQTNHNIVPGVEQGFNRHIIYIHQMHRSIAIWYDMPLWSITANGFDIRFVFFYVNWVTKNWNLKLFYK